MAGRKTRTDTPLNSLRHALKICDEIKEKLAHMRNAVSCTCLCLFSHTYTHVMIMGYSVIHQVHPAECTLTNWMISSLFASSSSMHTMLSNFVAVIWYHLHPHWHKHYNMKQSIELSPNSCPFHTLFEIIVVVFAKKKILCVNIAYELFRFIISFFFMVLYIHTLNGPRAIGSNEKLSITQNVMEMATVICSIRCCTT